MEQLAPFDEAAFLSASAVCLGTGRFLRAVLAPILSELGCEIVFVQGRGSSFEKYMQARKESTPPGERPTYEVDTVLSDGAVLTTYHKVAACGSLSTREGCEAFFRLPEKLRQLRYIGVGITEAGIVHNGSAILALAEFLHGCFRAGRGEEAPLSVLNTDNLPFNGDALRNHVFSCDFSQQCEEKEAFAKWLESHVVFHNTMVDRITSHRDGSTEVPRSEPLPHKAFVIEDLRAVLPAQLRSVPGVLVRTQANTLSHDIQLKLRIANGLHTAMVYVMALSQQLTTDQCTLPGSPILPYLEHLFECDIVHLTTELGLPRPAVTPTFSEWMARLQHPHFGLDCFFVSQNATTKLGIRLIPSVGATLKAGETPSVFMAFSIAAALRFLTPRGEQHRLAEQPPVFSGRLDPKEEGQAEACLLSSVDRWEYVPGLSVNLTEQTYDFKDGDGLVPFLLRSLGEHPSAAAVSSITTEVLSRVSGFDPRSDAAHARLAAQVAQLLHRMLTTDTCLAVLRSLRPCQPLYLERRQLEEAVSQEVHACEAVDVHTHLFAACYGNQLMQYGIDAMLSLAEDSALACSSDIVTQYLAVAEESFADFVRLPRQAQAERVWDALFVQRSPLSEACKGVITTLNALGLEEYLAQRDLEGIRSWYASQDGDKFNEKVMRLAKLKSVICSHSPFFAAAQLEACLNPPPRPPRYLAALEVDSLLEHDWAKVLSTLHAAEEPRSLRGVRSLLSRCVAMLQPEYLSVSTPYDFEYPPKMAASAGERSEDTVLDADISTPPPTAAEVFDHVLLPLCRSARVPLLLRMGTRRQVNPMLGINGDSLGRAGLGALVTLCSTHPDVKFIVTVLSHNDQQEAAILASKFRNLHLWGCWWFSNTPASRAQSSSMRLEILGTQFTYHASSARVHDHLIYKWRHSRADLARILTARYSELMEQGWRVSRGDVRRDVARLLGGSFEEFCKKQLS
ncbi:hypothetical protein AB1Y20_007914 [Prymnesium parvum]|uniref:Mannitol dehydrogenase N-terminal domain-containing protein n=1 Tax=Prymnesium parvum TaxID=97485 RepID=A0AB34ISW3_PRYPA